MEQRIAESALSRDISALHMEAFCLCVAIAIVVVCAMIYSLVQLRRSQGGDADRMSHSTKIEILWTVIPVLIVILVAIPAAELILKLEH
jgi:cytochrome c oxidase subunit 2